MIYKIIFIVNYEGDYKGAQEHLDDIYDYVDTHKITPDYTLLRGAAECAADKLKLEIPKKLEEKKEKLRNPDHFTITDALRYFKQF